MGRAGRPTSSGTMPLAPLKASRTSSRLAPFAQDRQDASSSHRCPRASFEGLRPRERDLLVAAPQEVPDEVGRGSPSLGKMNLTQALARFAGEIRTGGQSPRVSQPAACLFTCICLYSEVQHTSSQRRACI